MKKCFLFLIPLFFFFGCSAPSVPETVVDQSGLLTPEEITTLQKYNTALLKEHDIDFRIILEKNGLRGAAFNARTNALMEKMAQNTQSEQGRMILLYIDSSSDLSRFEISGDLEEVYTDVFSGYIQQQQMVYFFRKQRIRDGVLAASEMIYERARDASLGKSFSTPKTILAGGGGATTEARIADKTPILRRDALIATEDIQAGSTPMETVMIYKLSMRAGNTDPDKDIFTEATQEMMRQWTVTPAQQKNGARGIEFCSQFASQLFFSKDGKLAVIRYPTNERKCNPWFLQNEDNRWRLDLKSMQQAIGFNQKNQYHFRNHNHAYGFAFTDLRFDKNGYPYE